MKITPKFQQGGMFDSFFTVYNPLDLSESTKDTSRRSSRKSDDDDDEKGKLTQKDFFNMIKELKGLPNEMQSLISDLTTTFRMSNLTGIDPEDLTTTYLHSLYQMTVFNENKLKFDESIKTARESGAMAEPAISMDGKLVIQDEDGNLDTISVETYFNNPEEYNDKIMTASNLAYYRQYDPRLVNNQSIFEVINNSMGFESFQKLIDLAQANLTSSEYDSHGMFMYDQKALEGLQVIKELSKRKELPPGSVTLEGLYKYNIIDKNKLDSINYLTSYLVKTLPNRAKTWASIKTGEPNKNKATQDLVLNYLLSQNESSHTFDIDYKGSSEKLIGNTGSKSSKEEPKMTYLTAIQMGYGGNREEKKFNEGNNLNFTVTGTTYGGFLNQKQETISNLTLDKLLTETGLIGITNSNSILFGMTPINPNIFSKIAIQNTGGMTITLPCVKQDGNTIPNFELMRGFSKKLSEVEAQLGKINPNATTEELERYREQRMRLLTEKIKSTPELQELLDATGYLDETKFANFFVVDGLASNMNMTFDEFDQDYVTKIKDEEDKNYFKEITGEEGAKIWQPWVNDDIYKSKIFIPIQTNNRLAAMLFSKQTLKDSVAMKVESEIQQAQASNLNSTNSNIL